MWTRLLYLNLNTACKPRYVGNYKLSPALSQRYQDLLAKEFRKVGLPFIANPPKDDSNNPRHLKPPERQYELFEKRMRHEKILANLRKADEEILKHRQENINKRPYKGYERFVKEVVPDWVNMLRDEQSERKEEEGQDEQE